MTDFKACSAIVPAFPGLAAEHPNLHWGCYRLFKGEDTCTGDHERKTLATAWSQRNHPIMGNRMTDIANRFLEKGFKVEA